MLNALDLFSGIGGISYGLREWVRPVAYCEIDPYCQGVLLSRMGNGELQRAPIFDDIKNLRYRTLCYAPVGIIYGGFPCQDISIAGLGKGLEGERSGLFFEILRLAEEIQPQFIFLENVPAITSRGGLRVVKEIATMGYDCRWCVISAASVGAMHKRERWFLLAKSRCERFNEGTNQDIQPKSKESERPNLDELCWGKTESAMGRKANGIPCQMDRIRGLGNAVVPEQAKKAFKILMGLK